MGCGRWAGTLVVALGGCAKSAAPTMAYAEMDVESIGGGRDEMTRGKSMPPPPPAPAAMEAEDWEEPPDPSSGNAPVEAAPGRMVHYDAWVELMAPRPKDVVDDALAIVVAFGGYGEIVGDDRAVFRVPVASFEQAWTDVSALGTLVDRAVTARDVTDAYTDFDLRLKTSLASRDRLVALLELAKDEQQQITLLRQIQRLTEEIDVMQAQLRTLGSLAALSRLSLTVQGVQSWDAQPGTELMGFTWIDELDPFDGRVSSSGDRLVVSVPDGFVRPDKRGPFYATSADGSVLRAGRLLNEPVGTTAFWVSALEDRLAGGFASSEALRVGARQGWRWVGHGDDPYVWWVLVEVRGRFVELTEVLFPTAEQEARYQDAARAALSDDAVADGDGGTP